MRSIINAFVLPLAFTCCLMGSSAQADVVWNESIQGDLSSDFASPTAVSFLIGSNTVIGTLTPDAGDDRDFMTFTIAPGQALTGLTLDSLEADGAGFQGINLGSSSFIPSAGTASSFLGLEFVVVDYVGQDMLPLLAASAGPYGAAGFTVPLGPGTYSYVIQEITPGQEMSYQLSFNVIPEPSATAIICLVGLVTSVRRRRQTSCC